MGILNFFKNRDKIGKPVHLTFNGGRDYQTVPGGLCSCIAFIVLLIFFAQMVVGFLQPAYTQVTNTSHMQNLLGSQELYNITSEESMMSIRIRDAHPEDQKV